MYFIANWKMYLNEKESGTLAKKYVQIFNSSKNIIKKRALQIIVCPSVLGIPWAGQIFKKTKIKLGAQDGFWVEKGAYTGAVSFGMLKETGVQYSIIGHSERRRQFNETDSEIVKKIKAAWSFGITPILCIGETKEERDNNDREKVLKRQISVLNGVSGNSNGSKKVIIAYEPVWAVGTGEACLAPHVKDVVEELRVWLKKLNYDPKTPILYGGSVDSANIGEYIKNAGVDGVLAGGSSTRHGEVKKMIQCF